MQEMLYATYEGMDEDGMEAAMGMVSMFTSSTAMAAMTVPTSLIFGGIISLIVGAIKKNV